MWRASGGAFNEILRRKDSSMQTQIGTLQMKMVTEDKAVEAKTHELLAEWEKGKPVQVCCVQCGRSFYNYVRVRALF